MRLTRQQRKDVELLVNHSDHSTETAILEVIKPRRKVRAPTMDELENMKKVGGRQWQA